MKKILLLAAAVFAAVAAAVIIKQALNNEYLRDKAGSAALISAALTDPAAAAGIYSGAYSSFNEPVSDVTEEENPSPLPDSTEKVLETDAAPAGTAVGTITEKFISPYSAADSFGKIYLKNNTSASVNIESELAAGINLKMQLGAEPEVLIMHTHATESYMTELKDYYTAEDISRSTDNSLNVVRIGGIIADTLTANGISVLHDETQHDAESYTGSYDRSGETVKSYLQRYPSIKVVLDIHRDSVGTDSNKVKAVCDAEGKTAAQIMLVMGCGEGTAVSHPEWRQNLRLALRFQQAAEIMYPGLARAVLLAPHCYNQNLTGGSMLIEIGTEANTLEEAMYSGRLTGDILARVLKSLR